MFAYMYTQMCSNSLKIGSCLLCRNKLVMKGLKKTWNFCLGRNCVFWGPLFSLFFIHQSPVTFFSCSNSGEYIVGEGTKYPPQSLCNLQYYFNYDKLDTLIWWNTSSFCSVSVCTRTKCLILNIFVVLYQVCTMNEGVFIHTASTNVLQIQRCFVPF